MAIVIEQGSLRGQQHKTKLMNKPYVSFLGIPYAKPPTNELRFKPPVKHPGWSGVLNAFTEGNMCLQYDAYLTKKIIGSEDCLYLNIFVPQETNNENKAVMVFIHGGAFNFGSASPDWYSPNHLLDENVIVVTLNYRLNVLGFLNLDVDECPGNMGLKDQLFAIKWVKANISAFGGDPDNITIFGESAGSASVHCHLLSPLSTGLFRRAIMQSGCIFNSWAFHKNHQEAAFNLAKRLGCPDDDPKKMVQFLQNVPATDLVMYSKMKEELEDGDTDILHYEFVPSVESEEINDKFLPARPEILAKTASQVPIILGINSMEGLAAFVEKKLGNIFDYYKNEKISLLLDSRYNEKVINKVKNFYFKELNLESESSVLEKICQMFSDIFIIKDYHRGLKYFLNYNVKPIYNYEFKFDGKINTFKKFILALKPEFLSVKGACHGDEMSYMFYGRLFGFAPKLNSPEFRMCKTMSKLWTNFAKTGDPNSSDLNFAWNPTSANSPKYLSFNGDDTRMVNGLLYSSRMKFWEDIYEIIESK